MAKIDFQNVYDIVKMIPYGRVTTYGAIAEVLGIKGSARYVGYAMNHAHSDPTIPAHRVVNRQGLLTGRHHFPPEQSMQSLLESEGVVINDHQVNDFKTLFWDPSTII